MKLKKNFSLANREAAKIIAANPVRYAGLPLQWAGVILNRPNFSRRFRKRKLISMPHSEFAIATTIRKLTGAVNPTVSQQLGFAQRQKSGKSA